MKRGIENGEGETGRDLERLATAWTMMAEIAAQRGKAAPPGRKDPCYLQAIQYLDRAKEAHETAGRSIPERGSIWNGDSTKNAPGSAGS